MEAKANQGQRRQTTALRPGPRSDDKLAEIATRLADGSLKPIVSHTYPMNQAIDAARAYENKVREGCIVIHPQEWTEQ